MNLILQYIITFVMLNTYYLINYIFRLIRNED